jgi:hypothetical protein
MIKLLPVFRIFLVLALGPAAILMAHQAEAQKFLENYKIPMPEISLIPSADFNKATIIYTDTPYNDRALGFEIRVQKDWQKSRDSTSSTNQAVGNKILEEVVKFYGPPNLDQRSFMTVKALKLDYQLTAEQWFIQYLLANSYTLQGIKTIDDTRVEALYVYVEKDVTYVVRSMTQLNGKRAVMAQYYVPSTNWEAEKQMQAQSIASFKLLNKIEEDVEPMEKYHFLDIAELKYPTSWKLQADQLMSIDRLKIVMLNVASEEYKKDIKYKLLNGKIGVSLVSYHDMKSVDAEIKRFKDEFRESGMLIGSFIEARNDFKLDPAMISLPVEVYEVTDTGNDILKYELWFLLMEAGDYYYFVTLLTPSRDEDYFLWSRNTQTFRVIAKTIAPLAGSLTDN